MKIKHFSSRFALPRAAALLLALLLVLAGCAGNGAATQPPTPSEGGADTATQPPAPSDVGTDTSAQSPAPGEVSDKALFGDFTAADTEGNEVTNDIFADYEVTMVNIWASFCGPCINEMPDLAELDEEYRARGFQVVGIVIDATDFNGNVDDATLADALDVIQSTGADYTHIIPTAGMFEVFLHRIVSVPTTVFVNSAGEIIGSSYVGSMAKSDWAGIIEEKLG